MTTFAIHLRPASFSDEAFLYELYASTRNEEFVFLPDPERSQLLRLQFTAQQGAYTSRFPGSEHMMILNSSEPVGRIWLARTEDEIRIIDISLLPQHRRLGIGSAVYRGVLAEAGAAGKRVVASVLKSNVESLRFHVRCGFSITESDGLYHTVTHHR